MQHTTGVAVVATHLAQTDRRALSQAWYSALHLAERPATATPALLARAAPPAAPHGSAGPADAARRSADDVAREPRAAARTTTARFAGGDADRRIPKTELARRIERGLTRRPLRAPTSFAVRGAGGRVALIVRSDGARTRVVAVCAPPLRERVERALAHARFALAGRGLRAEVA